MIEAGVMHRRRAQPLVYTSVYTHVHSRRSTLINRTNTESDADLLVRRVFQSGDGRRRQYSAATGKRVHRAEAPASAAEAL